MEEQVWIDGRDQALDSLDASVHANILTTIGATPLVRLNRVTHSVKPIVLAKVEFLTLAARSKTASGCQSLPTPNKRPFEAGRDDRRSDQRQHRRRAGDRRRHQGL